MARKKEIKVAELDILLGNSDTMEVTQARVDHAEEIAALEALVKADELATQEPIVESADEKWLRGVKNAQKQLGEFTLTPTARLILARACENVGSNKGFAPSAKNREDYEREERTQKNTQELAALFNAYDNDLIEVLECASAVHSIDSLPGVVYSTCFAVQKASNFVANRMYRTALDKNGGEAPALGKDQRSQTVRTEFGEFVADMREETSAAPYGLGPDGEEPLEFDGVREHIDSTECEHVRILRAYEDVHLYLQLLCELHGWDIDAPMPYMYVGNPDGTFTPVWGAEQTLDMQEVRSKASQAKRAVRRTEQLGAMLAHARSTVLKAGRKAA